MIDAELKAIGELELANAFYREYSRLVLKYEAAAAGLDMEAVTRRISDMSNPYSINDANKAVDPLHIVVVGKDGVSRSCQTMYEAIELVGDKLIVAGKTVFEWNDKIGWKYPDNKSAEMLEMAP